MKETEQRPALEDITRRKKKLKEAPKITFYKKDELMNKKGKHNTISNL